MALLVEEGRGVDRERDAELALAAGVVQLDHVVGVLSEVIAGRIDERLEVEPLAVEGLGAADADRSDDVGGLPDAIWVASASRAPSYGTASNVRWMFGWEALNSSTTCCSTSTCSGASPLPRQQYQRSSTTSPLPAGCDAGGAADEPGAWLSPGALVVAALTAGSDEQGDGRYQNQQS